MKIIGTALALGTLAATAALPALGSPGIENFGAQHAVFVMTNDADGNEVIAYERTPYGTLRSSHKYQTGGRGSGGKVDPLASQGSLTLSDDGSVLLAANAGSGSVSVFRVFGSRLLLTDRAPAGGAEPNSIAQHGKLVYVLNTAGSSSVVGFRLQEGRLKRIPDSLRFLSGNLVNSASVAFSADGRYLAVTERATNSIDVFKVLADGRLSAITVNPSAVPGVFAAIFAPNGALLVSETGNGAPNSSTISSYSVATDGTLLPVSTGVPTLGGANCWNVVTPNGRFVYASNSGSSSISGFEIGAHGALTPLGSTVVGFNPAGSVNIDIAVSA
ncbi:MAG: beta-propeller fold lactonase family protein, partial [Gammaproteobacteria bacterium]